MRRVGIVIAMIGIVGMLASTAAFATGTQEGAPAPESEGRSLAPGERSPHWGPMWHRGMPVAEDLTELSGTLSLVWGARPALVTEDGSSFVLMYPYHLTTQAGLGDGDPVTVEGYRAQAPERVQGSERARDPDAEYFIVATATVDGTEYDLSELHRGPMATRKMHGHRHGGFGSGPQGRW